VASTSVHIAVVNESTVLTDVDVANYVVAQQYQVSYHFKPHWGPTAVMTEVAAGSVPASSWQLVFLDDSDQAGALGYHDLTSSGLPLGKVFAKTDLQNGYKWSITASHECLEMLGDPWVDAAVQVGKQTFYALEVCDACEADSLGYETHGVWVSDFVLPPWFSGEPGPYDYKGHISSARQLLPGGYIGEWTPSTGWTQKTADTAAPASRRLELRQRKHSGELKRSTR
jgi:hypothetical protein